MLQCLMVRQKESGQMQLGRRTGPGARRRWSVVYTSDSQGLRRTVLWGVVSRAKRGKEGEREEALTAHCRVAKAQEGRVLSAGLPRRPAEALILLCLCASISFEGYARSRMEHVHVECQVQELEASLAARTVLALSHPIPYAFELQRACKTFCGSAGEGERHGP